jgi:hypothetical protein
LSSETDFPAIETDLVSHVGRKKSDFRIIYGCADE